MKKYLFFLSAINIYLVLGCSTFTPSKYTVENDPKNNRQDFSEIRKQFCSGDKKIRDFKFHFEDKDLKIETGIPTSVASRIQDDFQKERNCRFKSTIYELIKSPSYNYQYYEVSQELFDRIGKEGLGSYGQYGNCKAMNFFIQSPKQKNLSYTAGVCSRNSGEGSYILNSDVKLDIWNSYELKIPVITNLVEFSTILEPVEFQNKTYIENEEQNCKEKPLELLGVDSEEHFSAEHAINQKDRIWKRYITYFTSVKEVHQEDSVKVELTLDMTGFCKYGRSLDDLRTQ